MRRWIRAGVAAAAGIAAAGVGAAIIADARWGRATAGAIHRLLAARGAGAARAGGSGDTVRVHDPARLEGLPAPVARYLAFALAPGQPIIRAARVRWSGEFHMRPDAAWSPFTAMQHVTARPPGFVWDARIRMAPLVSVRVRDGYVDGEGAMDGRIAGLVPVAAQRGTPEMAMSSLQRWLGEAVWIPTMLLPGEGVEWSAIDDSTARATLTDRGTTISADFHFAPTGEAVRFTAMRYRDVDGTPVLTPFEGRMTEYERVRGMMVPRRGEVAWLLPEGRFAYWRGRLESIEFDAAER